MKKKLKNIFRRLKSKSKNVFDKINKKTRPMRELLARPITKWGRSFERSFSATANIVMVFRKTLTIAGVFTVGGFILGSISFAALVASAKVASMVAGITLGREMVTRLFTDKKKENWENEIGQKIVATKIQKQKLTATQKQINRLTNKFNDVSGPTKYQQEKLKIIVSEMQELAKQVTIKEAPPNIPKDRYVFAQATKSWKAL